MFDMNKFEEHPWGTLNDTLLSDVQVAATPCESYPADRVLPPITHAYKFLIPLHWLISHFLTDGFDCIFDEQCMYSKSYIGYCLHVAELLHVKLASGDNTPITFPPIPAWMTNRGDVPGQDPLLLATIQWNDPRSVLNLFPIDRSLVHPGQRPCRRIGDLALTTYPFTAAPLEILPGAHFYQHEWRDPAYRPI